MSFWINCNLTFSLKGMQSWYIYIYIYIHIKKTNFITCDHCEYQKITYFSIQIYFRTVFLHQCMCVCVKDTCWKFSIYYKFTIKESLRLTKGTYIYIYIYITYIYILHIYILHIYILHIYIYIYTHTHTYLY